MSIKSDFLQHAVGRVGRRHQLEAVQSAVPSVVSKASEGGQHRTICRVGKVTIGAVLPPEFTIKIAACKATSEVFPIECSLSVPVPTRHNPTHRFAGQAVDQISKS